MKRPETTEYQSKYLKNYIDLVPGNDVLKTLETQLNTTRQFLSSLSEEKGNYAYADGKWTIKEVLGHMIDTERVMSDRAFRFSRKEKQSLPGFDQDEYVKASNLNQRTMADIINEFFLVRQSNIHLFKSFDEEVLSQRGNANGNEITVRTLLFVIAGHELHHLNVIKEKYLN